MITIAHDFGINAPDTNSMHVDCFTHRWNRRSQGDLKVVDSFHNYMSIKLLCEDHESGYKRGDFLRRHPCFKSERKLQFYISTLTFRHRTSSIYDRRFAALQRTLFIYLINKYISLSDICLTVHH